MELIACDCLRKREMESCFCVHMGMACTEARFAKSCGNEEDPNQANICDSAGDVESESGSEDEDGDN